LSGLVEALVRQVPGVRFRLSSLEATEVDRRLAALLRSGDGRVTPHLHAPLQSGSDPVLRRMGRHWYTARRYADAVSALVRDRDVFGLGADVICGFPGETEDDHHATLSLVEELPFTYLHVFPFSSRPGTSAEHLGPLVAASVIERRAGEVRQVAARKARAYRASRAGGMADVICTRGGNPCDGITEDFVTLRISESLPRGTRLRARLTIEEGELLAIPEHAAASATRYLSPS
jgi:threonylcarbamoyladenosine tRNA methylthiotransferase MtaB